MAASLTSVGPVVRRTRQRRVRRQLHGEVRVKGGRDPFQHSYGRDHATSSMGTMQAVSCQPAA